MIENNRQYYEGAQGFRGDGTNKDFQCTFDTDLVFYDADPTNANYALNNFKLYSSTTGIPGSWSEVTSGYTVGSSEVGDGSKNIIKFTVAPALNLYLVAQLKKLDGGNYGSTSADKAYGNTVEENYGSYAYTKLDEVIENFLVAYVGAGKIIQDVKRTDVVFHAKRALQEFSYDTLKSVKSQELNIPHNLSVPLPQDYVNYVRTSWIDNQGVQHVIMPTNNLTTSPYEIPLQDNKGVAMQDNFDNNVEGTSIVEDRWKTNYLKGNYPDNNFADNPERGWEYYYGWPEFGYGQLYGLDPKYANINGYFNINEREGKMSFSANLVDKLIVLEYISDGLSTDLDTKIPKLAEEAIYAYIKHAILASRINQPEYLVQRLKREASAQLRNSKIRLSNIKLDEIIQVMRGKSKWIKH